MSAPGTLRHLIVEAAEMAWWWLNRQTICRIRGHRPGDIVSQWCERCFEDIPRSAVPMGRDIWPYEWDDEL